MESLFLKLPPKLGRTWRKRSPWSVRPSMTRCNTRDIRLTASSPSIQGQDLKAKTWRVWQHQVERGEYKIEEGWDGIKAGFLQRPGVGQVVKRKQLLTHKSKVGQEKLSFYLHMILFPPGRTSRGSANKRWLLLAQASSAGLDSCCTFTEPDSSLVFFRVTPSVRLGID